MDVTEVGEDDAGPWAKAEASLWVDGKRIYEASDLGMRIVEDGAIPDGEESSPNDIEVLDPAVDRWLADHRPTWNRPALPMMSMVDRPRGARWRPAACGSPGFGACG